MNHEDAGTTTPAIAPNVAQAHTEVEDGLRRADTKSAALGTLAGIMFVGVGTLAATPSIPPVARVLVGVTALPILGAIYMLLMTIRPSVANPMPGSWLDAGLRGPGVLLDVENATTESVAADVAGLAQSAIQKYRRVRHAVHLLIAALPCLAIAVVACRFF